MNIVLREPELEKYIDDQVRAGHYGSAEDVVAAALARQMQEERLDDFAPGQLEKLLAVGEADLKAGNVVSLEEAREHFRKLSVR